MIMMERRLRADSVHPEGCPKIALTEAVVPCRL